VDALTPKVQKDTLDSFRSGKVVKICLYVEKQKHRSHDLTQVFLSAHSEMKCR
jgi:hypothetical protein